MDLKNSESDIKAWKDIWSAGPTAQAVNDIQSVGSIATKIAAEYHAA
jgi:hypothetical protein